MSRPVAPPEIVASSRCARAFGQESDFVHRLLRRHGVREGDIDDLVQEVFTILWRRWEDYDGERPLRPWLAGIAVRLACKHRERRQREVPSRAGDLDRPLDEPTDARIEARALLTGALERISETNRTALMLHELDGLSVPEVAETLAIPMATAYARINRGRRAFVQAVQDLQADRPKDAPVIVPGMLLQMGRAGALGPAPLPWPQLRGPRVWPAAAIGAAIALITALAVHPRAALPPATSDRDLAQTSSPGQARTLMPEATRATDDERAQLARGLTGYWRFDEAAGTIAHDDSGHANHCRLRFMDAGEPWTEGTLEGALRFTARSRVMCPQPDALAQGPSDLTIALWMRTPVLQNYEQTLVARHLAGNEQRYFLLAVLRDSIVLDSRVWKVRLVHPLADPTRWAHVAFTHARDGATKLYVDGREIAAATAEPGGGGDLAETMAVGLSWNPKINGWWKGFRGDLDELVAYERVLSGAEIGALAARTQPSP